MLTKTSVGRWSRFVRIAGGAMVVCAVLTGGNCSAEDFCALELRVVGRDGTPARSTWIELTDPKGAVVRRERIEGPDVKICDFGFGPHTIKVGMNECLPVTISNLQLIIGAPLRLTVISNPCGYHLPTRTGCLLYLRASDMAGRPVPNAKVSIQRYSQAPPRTDGYGRYQILFGGEVEIEVAQDGFEPARARVLCAGTEQHDVPVILKSRVQP